MVRLLVILLIWPVVLNAQIGPPDPLLRTQNVRKLVEETKTKWVITKMYNEQQQVIEIIHGYRNQKKKHQLINYKKEPRLQVITYQYQKEDPRFATTIDKIRYDEKGRIISAEGFLADTVRLGFVLFDNFQYQNELIRSYRGTFRGTHFQLRSYSFSYDSLDRLIKKEDRDEQKGGGMITSYTYDEEGRVIRSLEENLNPKAGNPYPVSQVERHKVLYSYEDHDNHGNWQKCYYITEKGKIWRADRKITYYAAMEESKSK